MKLYTKTINDKIVTKLQTEIVINKVDYVQLVEDGEPVKMYSTVCNPTHEMLIEDGWEEYIEPTHEITPEELFIQAKNQKLDEIINYDSSTEVNEFYIGDMSVWLDKNTRAGLKLRFEAEKAMGVIETTLWYNDIEFILPVDIAVQMLYSIEIYASKCYDNTNKNLAEVNKMTSIVDIINYDITKGYPEKLTFTI